MVGALREHGGAERDAVNWHGLTALMVAAIRGQAAVAAQLVEAGADATLRATGGDNEGKTALEIAEANGTAEVAAVLEGLLSAEEKAEWDSVTKPKLKIAAARRPRPRPPPRRPAAKPGVRALPSAPHAAPYRRRCPAWPLFSAGLLCALPASSISENLFRAAV